MTNEVMFTSAGQPTQEQKELIGVGPSHILIFEDRTFGHSAF